MNVWIFSTSWITWSKESTWPSCCVIHWVSHCGTGEATEGRLCLPVCLPVRDVVVVDVEVVFDAVLGLEVEGLLEGSLFPAGWG
jgi:hypothetical protein